MIKLTSLFLCLSLLLGQITPVNATNTEQYVTFDVPIISNECPDQTSVVFYGYDGSYYLSIQDIAKLTRFEIFDEDEYAIWLMQGERIVSISKEDGSLLDCNYIEQGTIPIKYYDGQYLLEGIPMLTYLGATCNTPGDGYLHVMMPWITFWEALMPEYEDYCFDINGMYGGETSVKVTVICDIIAELMDTTDGGILPAGKDERYENALYAALDVDMNEYEGVQALTALENELLNSFLSSATVTQKYQEKYERLKNSNENGAELLGLAEEMFETSMDCFWEAERKSGIQNWQDAFSSGNTSKMAEAAAENSETLYRQASGKAGLNKLSSYQDFLEVVMLTADVVSTSNNLIKYDIVTRELLKNSLSDDILRSSGHTDLAWRTASSAVTNRLSTDANILIGTAYDKITEFALEELTDKGISELLATLSSKANVYYAITKMAFFIVFVAFDDMFEAYASDLVAIDTNEIHGDVLEILNSTQDKARDEGYSNKETLQQLQSLYTLYYRLIISFSQNFAISLDEFGGKNRDEWVEVFAGKTGGSYSNYAAAYLYMITNCTITPISDYSSNIDEYAELLRKYDPSVEVADDEHQNTEPTEYLSTSNNDFVTEIVESQTGLHCEWAVGGDFDDDGTDEIYALLCTSSSDYSNGQLWHFTSTENRCVFYIEEAEFEMICDIAKTIPDWLTVEIIDSVDNIDEFISDLERRYF